MVRIMDGGFGLACAREVFGVGRTERSRSSPPSLNRMGCQEETRPGSWMCLLWSGARARCFESGRTERPGLLDPIQDPLVLDLEFSIALGLLTHSLPVGVVLPGVGRHIGQDGHLVDVGMVLWIYSFEFRMECLIAGAGQAGIAFGDLDEGISFMEVGVVVISWKPGSCGVGDLIGLRRESLVLHETAERFGNSRSVRSRRGRVLHLLPVPFRNNGARSYRFARALVPESMGTYS